MYVTLKQKNISYDCEVLPDSGTSRTIINKAIVDKIGFQIKKGNKSKISACNDTSLRCVGSVNLKLLYKGDYIRVEALVTPCLSENMLVSYNDLIRLGILNELFPEPIHRIKASATSNLDFDELCNEFKDVFDEDTVSPLKGDPMEIHLNKDDPSYKPIHVTTARKVPLHFQAEADKTLTLFLESGVIERVPTTEHVEWCSPGFFVPKPNGKVRLVVDYGAINKFIARPVHPFPSPRDILKDIKPESKWFMKLDATQGYYQIPLANDSKNFTCFLLPSGRYRFTRAPMGMSSSSDGFCDKSDHVFRPVPDLLKIVDDALIQAPTKQELLRKFKIALECCRSNNLNLSRKKLQFGTEIEFAGHIITESGTKPCPARTKAITEFPRPKDITQLRGFLGLVNQLAFLSRICPKSLNPYVIC